jgi:hypothetical protein
MVAWSSLSRRLPAAPPLPRPKLLRRIAPRDATADAREVSTAWEAFSCGASTSTKIRTIHGPRRARVLWRAGSWVVTLCAGAEHLTHGPTGLAVPGVSGREDCVELAEALVDAGLENVGEVVPQIGDVLERWRSARAA